MELRQYLTLVRHWLWLVILSVVIAASSSYFASKAATPLFRTTTTLMIGRATQDVDPNSDTLYTGQQLAYTYTQLAGRERVLQGVIDSLGLQMDWEALAGQVSTSVIPQTQLFEISVIDSDPYRAKVLADTIAAQLILQSPAADGLDGAEEAFSQAQLADLKTKIEDGQAELGILQEELDAANSAIQIRDLEGQIAVLETKISGWQSTYSQLLVSLRGGDVNTLSIVEEASIPSTPISPNVQMNVLLASAIGLVLAVGGAVLIEYLDDTVKTPEDVTRQLGLPVLGLIPRIEENGEGPVTRVSPRSPTTEAFRSLRTNIQFAVVDHPLEFLLVTSPSPKDGKSTIAVNLAIVLAQSERRVGLLDADLRRPALHKLLNQSNRIGLSDLFIQPAAFVNGALRRTEVPGLSVLTSGSLPPNPSELVGSERMMEIVQQMREQVDLVIIDTPPLVAVTDAAVLAPRADGVLLVIRPGVTKMAAAKHTVEQIKRGGANLIGVVLNDVENKRSRYYYYYRGYYSNNEYYGDSDDQGIGITRRRKKAKPHMPS